MYFQTVIIFLQLAGSYVQALVAQGAIPVLLRMLNTNDNAQQRLNYARIRYKAAVCLANVSANGMGLKAIHEHCGLEQLARLLARENASAPLTLICASILHQLKSIYLPMESIV